MPAPVSKPRALLRASLMATGLSVALLLAGCQEVLYSGLSEREANQMRQALMEKGISAEKRAADDGRHAIHVRRDDAVPALRVLESAGLPRNTFTPGIDLLKSDALVSSPAEDRARMAYALSQDLAATISGIDGVVTARVHLVLPEKPLMASSRPSAPPTASASVLVTYRAGHNLEAASLSIRQLVARSVDGLVPERVSVVLMPAQVQAPPKPLAPAAPRGLSAEGSWGLLGLVLMLGLLAGWAIARWRPSQSVGAAPAARPVRPVAKLAQRP